ncbi:chorismate mutase [Spirulina subsalsa]|uniref:chorismate mutase n=1 Tax=Spirulina subsalsa TaxID=54311 RepID=UPI0022373A81|nr:chorismate mutase [Spirulina subsalsa]
MDWKVRAIRGATTAVENTVEAIQVAVKELMDEIEYRNQLDPEEIISAVFTATPDLNAIFPASVARDRPNWDNVALLDVQQMSVENSLERCIRVLIHVNTPHPQAAMIHVYLGQAKNLRPDWNLAQMSPSGYQTDKKR